MVGVNLHLIAGKYDFFLIFHLKFQYTYLTIKHYIKKQVEKFSEPWTHFPSCFLPFLIAFGSAFLESTNWEGL